MGKKKKKHKLRYTRHMDDYQLNENNSDYSYIVDDDNHVVGKQVFRPNGVVDLYYSNDNFRTHSHDQYSSMDAYIDAIDNAFYRQGPSKGDVMHRRAGFQKKRHPWVDIDGVLEPEKGR